MSDRLQTIIYQFIDAHVDASRPMMIGLSGGADSLCLLHLLMPAVKYGLKLHIVHVDHGWRPESGVEAAQLELLAKQLGVPFHGETLNPVEISGNLEAGCRERRLAFFRQVRDKIDAQAVFLAHHADDQAETVLDRLLEGQSLLRLSGIAPVTQLNGLTIWRPLLAVKKEEIRGWLNDRGIIPFEDTTNSDPRYLRARMRTKIIPELSQSFGKQVAEPLCRIAEEVQEMRQWVDQLLADDWKCLQQGPFGVWLPFSENAVKNRFQCKALIRKFCERIGVVPTYPIVNEIDRLLADRAANKEVHLGHKVIHVDRGHLFVAESLADRRWNLKIEDCSGEGDSRVTTDWRKAWLGNCQVVLPKDDYRLAAPINTVNYPGGSSLSRWWNDGKVPAFLRHAVPVVWSGDRIAHEFLTGRRTAEGESEGWIRLTATLTD
jgi:tRNA(Ile)-lysidine synthase